MSLVPERGKSSRSVYSCYTGLSRWLGQDPLLPVIRLSGWVYSAGEWCGGNFVIWYHGIHTSNILGKNA